MCHALPGLGLFFAELLGFGLQLLACQSLLLQCCGLDLQRHATCLLCAAAITLSFSVASLVWRASSSPLALSVMISVSVIRELRNVLHNCSKSVVKAGKHSARLANQLDPLLHRELVVRLQHNLSALHQIITCHVVTRVSRLEVRMRDVKRELVLEVCGLLHKAAAERDDALP